MDRGIVSRLPSAGNARIWPSGTTQAASLPSASRQILNWPCFGARLQRSVGTFVMAKASILMNLTTKEI